MLFASSRKLLIKPRFSPDVASSLSSDTAIRSSWSMARSELTLDNVFDAPLQMPVYYTRTRPRGEKFDASKLWRSVDWWTGNTRGAPAIIGGHLGSSCYLVAHRFSGLCGCGPCGLRIYMTGLGSFRHCSHPLRAQAGCR